MTISLPTTAQEIETTEIPWRVQGAVYGAGLFSFSLNQMVLVIIPLWVLTLEPSPVLLGIALGSRHFLLTVFSIHAGSLMDRMGTRRVMLVFGCAAIVVHLIFPLTASIWVVIVLQMLGGFAGGMGWLGSQALIGQVMKGNAGCAGRLSFATRVGTLVAAPVVGAMWDFFGAWGAFVTMSLWIACGVSATALIPVTNKTWSAPEPSKFTARDFLPQTKDYMAVVALLAVPAVALVVFTAVIRHCAVSTQQTFYVVWLEQVGISGTTIGLLLSIGAVLASLATLAVGPLTKFMNSRGLMLIAVATMILSISLTPTLGNFGMLALVIGINGWATGLSSPLMISIMSANTDKDNQGKSSGLRNTANRLSSAILPVIMGGVIEAVGLEMSFYVVGTILLLILAPTVRALHLKETFKVNSGEK